MRMWHKDLIPVLPKQQLVAQWRELCAIVGNIDRQGTPNHLLVNKVMNYPSIHFIAYTDMILVEMRRRQYEVSVEAYATLSNRLSRNLDKFDTYQPVPTKTQDIYKDWHNERYLLQCYHNLEEKYDCGGISQEEWSKIEDFMNNRRQA